MKTFFGKLGAVLRRTWVWSLLLVLLLAVVVWFVGPLLAVDDYRFWESSTARLLSISVVFLGWGLAMVFASWRASARKKRDAEDQDVQEQLRRDGLIGEEQQELRHRFRQALRTLKTSSLYRGRSEKWRSELPWYLLIGPQGSGKTSLLDFSGLDFPLNRSEQQRLTKDVLGTRYADWYFADHAVLIDTAGRYLTQPDAAVDGSAWETLLGLLRRRRARPLNGVLVNLPVDQLQGGSELELENLARQTRQRLHEIHQRLNVDVPVYLVLSKSDRILGFDEFFEQLSREESDQVLGASFRKEQNGSDAQVVRQEFEELLRRLNSQVILRMHQERRRRVRADLVLHREPGLQRGIRVRAEQARTRAGMRMRAHVDHRVDQQRHLRARAERIDGIAVGIDRRIEAVAQPRRDVPAGREPHDPDTLRIDPPARGIGADHAHRTLRIGQCGLAITAACRQPVTQHEQRHAPLVDEGRHQGGAFLVEHDALVAATGHYQQGAAVRARRPVYDQVGRADVVDVAVRQRRIVAALDHIRHGGRCGFPWHLAIRPQRDPVRGTDGRLGIRYRTLGRVGQTAGQQQEGQQGQHEAAAHPGTSFGQREQASCLTRSRSDALHIANDTGLPYTAHPTAVDWQCNNFSGRPA